MLLFAWLVINSYRIFYRQAQWRTLPLVIFYVLLAALVVLEFYNGIFAVSIFCENQFLPQTYPQELNFFLSLVLIWMVVELCIRITFTINILARNNRTNITKIENIIKYGRLILAGIIVVCIVSSTVYIYVKKQEINTKFNINNYANFDGYYGGFELVSAILLSFTIIFLIV